MIDESQEIEELSFQAEDVDALMTAFTKAITEIDRYFVDDAESQKDAEFVFDVLDGLAKGIMLIGAAKDNGEH